MLGLIVCAILVVVAAMGVRILTLKAKVHYLTTQEAYWRHVAAHQNQSKENDKNLWQSE